MSRYAPSEHFAVLFSSLSVFAFFALTFVTSSGYGYPAALLMFGGCYVLFRYGKDIGISRELLLLLLTFMIFAGLWHLEVCWHDQITREHDKPFRFIAAAIAAFFLIRYPPKETYLWSGIIVAAMSAGGIAFYERLYLHAARADGHTNAIQFGNLAMLYGLLCLTGIGWALKRVTFRRMFLGLMILGFTFGLLASLLSGSRGGWIGLPFILLFISRQYWGVIPRRMIAGLLSGLLILIVTAYMLPSTGIQKRVHEIFSDLQKYSEGVTATSIGTRLELWRGSLLVIAEHPLWGMGRFGYEDELVQLKEDGIIKPAIISHSHNEILDAGVRRGVVGIITLLLLYIVPALFFKRYLNGKDTEHLALAGLVIVFAYIDFGLTQVFFAHNNGVMVYAFAIIFLASIVNAKRNVEDNHQQKAP